MTHINTITILHRLGWALAVLIMHEETFSHFTPPNLPMNIILLSCYKNFLVPMRNNIFHLTYAHHENMPI